jgi:hypothetical protein
MTEDAGNLKPQRPKHRLTSAFWSGGHPVARAIGGILGAATGMAVSKLTGSDSFLPWMVLLVGGGVIGNVIGVLLAQKIASK